MAPRHADLAAELIRGGGGGGVDASLDAPTYGYYVDSEGDVSSDAGDSDSEVEDGGGVARTASSSAPHTGESPGAGDWATGYFLGGAEPSAAAAHGGHCAVAIGEAGSRAFRESALLGSTVAAAASAQPVYLNTHEPFVVAAVGVQGSGKSHTLSCVLESCLLPFPVGGVVKLAQPQAALVLHYDQSPQSICEATGLIVADPAIARQEREHECAPGASGPPPPLRALPRDRLLILVSPTFYRQRRAFYGDGFIVRPLLLRWRSLTADHIKRIMRISDLDSAPLYVATMLNLLRRFQRAGVLPSFVDFVACVRAECDVQGQGAPLNQRLKLLESLVAESEENAAIVDEGGDVETACAPGRLVVVDLTDPLLAAAEANGIFHVILEQFRALPLRCGKVLALDEAHKYMTSGDGLSQAIVNLARLVRHDGLRLAVSTQSPLALAPELLELVTIAVIHRFHSRDWHTYLSNKLALPAGAFEGITQLRPGEALLFAARALECGATAAVAGGGAAAPGAGAPSGDRVRAAAVFRVHVRRRITADRGASRLNRAAAAPRATDAGASAGE